MKAIAFHTPCCLFVFCDVIVDKIHWCSISGSQSYLVGVPHDHLQICGEAALNTTSLRDLGVYGGSIVLRYA